MKSPLRPDAERSVQRHVSTELEWLSLLRGGGGLVKIDGLREPQHAAAAAASGADLLGFIFAPARRQVSAAMARACIDAGRDAAEGRTVVAVGVFVDASPSEIAAVVDEAGLDVVQLHGEEPPESLLNVRAPVFKALRPKPEAIATDVIAEINRYRSTATPPIGFLIDGYSEQASGGTGARADWVVAAEINAEIPILLAGGLDAENVSAAIRRVRPWGVDVSSGVEIGGVKDADRIAAFIRAARAAFAA